MSAWVGSVSVFLLGLASGVSCSHLLQLGPKKTLPPAQLLAVQQVLLRNYGAAIGALEVAHAGRFILSAIAFGWATGALVA